jgi:chaperonin GroEL
VLTYNILNEANRLIAAGHNPMELRRGVEEAGAEVLKALEKLSEPVTGKKSRVAEVAAISAGDASIGELIADVIEKVGAQGVVTVEEGQGLSMESEVVEGFTFDRGYSSALMVTDVNRQEAEYKNPAIVITDKKISSVAEISPLIERIAQSGKKDLVLIAEDVEGEALAMLVLNKLRGAFNTVAVKAPSFGDRRKETLQDIAVLTGATVISEDIGLTFENADLGVLGTARKVLVSKDATTIIEGGGSVADVANRVAQIQEQARSAKSEYDKEQYEKRAAALEGKVAVIKVGGATETEIEEKKYRVDDAVAATKAALAEGIVAGGGVTLVNLSDSLKTDGADSHAAGRSIVKQALLQPFRQLMLNAGLNAEALLAQVQSGKSGQGIDVMNPGKLADLKTAGVVDPVAVTRQAIQNAVSIAATAMTMGALVVDVPKDDPSAGGGMPGGGMGMM